jgi:hypothetical protein
MTVISLSDLQIGRSVRVFRSSRREEHNVKFILQFGEVYKTGLASLGHLTCFCWMIFLKSHFLHLDFKLDDLFMCYDCLYERIIMVQSIMHLDKVPKLALLVWETS